MIKNQFIFTLAVIISLILSLQPLILNFANAQTIKKESYLVMYDNDDNDTNSKNPTLIDDSNNLILLKPKIDVSIEGTPKSDKLMGGDRDDKIKGGKGNDILYGKDGNDKIIGEEGDDRISGGSGDDESEGGNGNDKIFGGKGDDILDGGEGIDIMIGGTGNDTFICDPSDILIDYNSTEGDKIIGSCSVKSDDDEKEIPPIPDNDTISSPEEFFESPLLPLNPNNAPQLEEFHPGPPPLNPNNNVPPNFESGSSFHLNDITPEFQSSPRHLLPLPQSPFHPNSDIPPKFEHRLPSEFQLPP